MAKMPAIPVARRAVYLLASLLPVWAVVALFTGGVGWMLGPLRISSRQPFRPLIIGLAIAGFYGWKYSCAEREADSEWLHHWAARALTYAVPLLVVLALYLGVHYGSFAAAGSDSYGYVSQARLWLSGIPRVEQPWVQDFPWPDREWSFSPLGYRPFSSDGTIVPTYPAGLPMMMVLSVQHSGSVRYYADRITLRYDWLQEGELDAALGVIAGKRRRAYLVVDDWEEKSFAPASRRRIAQGRSERRSRV